MNVMLWDTARDGPHGFPEQMKLLPREVAVLFSQHVEKHRISYEKAKRSGTTGVLKKGSTGTEITLCEFILENILRMKINAKTPLITISTAF